MAFTIYTHDSWGAVAVGSFQTLPEAQDAFKTLCSDPWYKQDGTVRALELTQDNSTGNRERLAWFAFG